MIFLNLCLNHRRNLWINYDCFDYFLFPGQVLLSKCKGRLISLKQLQWSKGNTWRIPLLNLWRCFGYWGGLKVSTGCKLLEKYCCLVEKFTFVSYFLFFFAYSFIFKIFWFFPQNYIVCVLVLRNSVFMLCDCGLNFSLFCHKFDKFKNGIASVFSSILVKSKLN